MPNILALSSKKEAEQQRSVQIKLVTAETKVQGEERERKTHLRDLAASAAFEQAFPDRCEQEKFITSYVDTSFKSFRPSGKIARSLAIHHWYKSAHSEQRIRETKRVRYGILTVGS